MRIQLVIWIAAAVVLTLALRALVRRSTLPDGAFTGVDYAAFPCAPGALPIGDVTVGSCGLFGCSLQEDKRRADPHSGPWVRVGPPLDAGAAQKMGRHRSVMRATRHLFYRRTRAAMHVVEMQVGAGAAPGWESVDLGGTALRYRIGQGDAVTALALAYGGNPPMASFAPVGELAPGVALTARRASACATPTLSFRPDGTFKVLQLADLHYSVAELACRDVHNPRACRSVADTNAAIDAWLDAEKPDLVVFTGDQLNGQGTSWDERSVLPTWLDAVVARRIPWAAVLGNHDSESGFLSRRQQVALLERYPYSVTRVGPPVYGAGNYDVQVLRNGTPAFALWFLDSGAHPAPSALHPLEWLRYDWVRTDQLTWLASRAAALRLPGMLFVHIPVPEAFSKVDRDADGRVLVRGVRLERFHRLGAQARAGLFDAARRVAVRVLVHGHMHNNADCRRIQGMWICFGGGASYAAYGTTRLERRCRVYELREHGARIVTWQRTASGARIDDAELTGSAARQQTRHTG